MIKLINDDILNVDFSGFPKINLCITSPPYNVSLDYGNNHRDDLTYDEYLKWSRKWIKKVYDSMESDGRFCLNVPFSCTPLHLNKVKTNKGEHINFPISADLTKLCQSVGFKFFRTIIWKKIGGSKTSWGSWRSCSAPFIMDPNESILIFYKDQWKRQTKGVSTISTKEFMNLTKNLWEIHPETHSSHPAPFPEKLPESCLKIFSYKDDIIMDCFLGSGTTGAVSARLNRSFIGIEKSKEYFDMAKKRIEEAELQISLTNKFMPDVPIDIKDNVEDQW